MSKKYPFFLIVGPTASGKSALAFDLAKKFKGAILNCDSLQFYRRMDIGTAKPPKSEQAQVPHYLFDILNPGEVLTAGDFRKLALQELERELNLRPVFGVGGSGFYIQALEKGMFEVPKADPRIDAEVRAQLERDGLPAMHAELLKLDQDYAEDLNPQDSYRIVRALVIIRQTGQRVSDFKRQFKPQKFPYPIFKMGLKPEREVLLPRIQHRVYAMLKAGFLEEVRSLVKEGFAEWPPLQSVGYKECLMVLNGQLSEDRLASQIIEKTSQLSKKQRTWFKRDLEIRWLDVASPYSEAERLVMGFLDQHGPKA